MSDEGEKTCPLCAEEMDLTDQQLKPCKCGYEVCVWCWHHIMEMAEKDETEGRCPACRTPYDKERIVGTASKCGRLVAEISVEKKKSQKAKTKTAEGRKQLSSIRVIQRNLVYIVGLPLDLADEDLLLHKEYFGQYGKVLKVSISRTSTGTIQQFANNTCSVYITYSKEEEAVRCIQSIHGFTLEGRSLRACFGTTKYCHAWLRNVPCTNHDCLYLHEIGSQEDSFSKDEIISAYSRVQQITGIANSVQRRSGSVLPPPVDDYCNNSAATTGKPVVKSTPNPLVSSARVSPPSSSAGRTGALPAAASWGSRGSNCQLSVGGMVSSNGPAKQKPDAAIASVAFSSAVAGMQQASIQSTDSGKKVILNGDIHPKEPKDKIKQSESKKQLTTDLCSNVLKDSDSPSVAHKAPIATDRQPSLPLALDNNQTNFVKELNIVDTEKERASSTDEKDQKLCSDVIPIGIDKHTSSQSSGVARPNGLSLDCFLVPRDQGMQQYLASPASKSPMHNDATSVSRSDTQSSVLLPSEMEDDFEMHRRSDAIVSPASLPSSSHSFNIFKHLRGPLHQHSEGSGAVTYTVNPVVNKQDEAHLAAIPSNGFVDNQVRSNARIGHFYHHRNQMGISDNGAANIDSNSGADVIAAIPSNGFVDNQVRSNSGIDHFYHHRNQMGISDNGAANIDSNSGADVIENSIISNILSLDLDSWDDSLKSPQNFVNLLGENERQQSSFGFSNSWKAQNGNQSRFSFARQEESQSHSFDVEPSFHNGTNPLSFGPAANQNRELYLDRLGNGYGTPQRNAEQYNGFGNSQSVLSANKLSAVSRTQISAPPGFSVPSRPPPGFSSHVRNDQTFDMKPGNHFADSSTSFRNPYQASPSANANSIADIEFIDPAILAVGKGRPPSSFGNSNIDMGPNFSAQTSNFENDSRLQLLMQRSLQSHQNFRYADVGDSYSSPNDAYGFNSRHMEPSQIGGLSSFSQYAHQPRGAMSNGHWDSWPEVMAGNNMGMAELLRNDRLSYNRTYGGYEESKFQMPGSGDLYNRTFGM